MATPRHTGWPARCSSSSLNSVAYDHEITLFSPLLPSTRSAQTLPPGDISSRTHPACSHSAPREVEPLNPEQTGCLPCERTQPLPWASSHLCSRNRSQEWEWERGMVTSLTSGWSPVAVGSCPRRGSGSVWLLSHWCCWDTCQVDGMQSFLGGFLGGL